MSILATGMTPVSHGCDYGVQNGGIPAPKQHLTQALLSAPQVWGQKSQHGEHFTSTRMFGAGNGFPRQRLKLAQRGSHRTFRINIWVGGDESIGLIFHARRCAVFWLTARKI